MNRLQELFYLQMKSDNPIGDKESTGTIKAWDNCAKALEEMLEDKRTIISDLINVYGTEREELGFINGFCYGVEIMAACVLKGGVFNG